MNGHHLILGELSDYLTGDTLTDTHDERYRQKIARLLVETLGYNKDEIITRRPVIVSAGNKKARIVVDFSIVTGDRIGMLIKYGPGSLTTRHTPTLAMARLMADYQVPIVVVTNGEDAEILDIGSEKVVARGIDQIPNRPRLMRIVAEHEFTPVSKKKMAMAARIVYCYEIDGACPCDTTVCRLEDEDPLPSGSRPGNRRKQLKSTDR